MSGRDKVFMRGVIEPREQTLRTTRATKFAHVPKVPSADRDVNR